MELRRQFATICRRATLSGNRISLVRCALILLAAGLVSTGMGCGNGRVKVSPVRGKVVYNGQGVPGTTVMFLPVDPPNEQVAKIRPFAYGEPDGQFELKTYVEGDGAPPGKYRVCIIAPAGGPGASKKDRPADALAASGVGVPPAIAKKYAKPDTSGIEVTIQAGENNLEPFVLTMGAGPATIMSGAASSQN